MTPEIGEARKISSEHLFVLRNQLAGFRLHEFELVWIYLKLGDGSRMNGCRVDGAITEKMQKRRRKSALSTYVVNI